MRKFNSEGVIDIGAIPALNISIISKEMKNDLQNEYVAMHQFNIKKYKNPTVKETIMIDKFHVGYLYQYYGSKRLKYARIFVCGDHENGDIGYELFPDNIEKLDSIGSLSEVEQHVLSFIYAPIPNSQYGIACSIFHNKDLFFHTHRQQSNYYGGFTYRAKDKIKIGLEFTDIGGSGYQADEIYTHVLPEGVVLLYI